MPQYKQTLKCLSFAIIIAVFGFIGPGTAQGRTTGQPIQFSHALHIKNNVKCIVCHSYFETTARAGLPGVNICRRCHEGVIQVSPEQRKIEVYYQSGQDIPWQRVYQMPDYVFFSHQRHVVFGRVPCQTCHGDIASQQVPLDEALVSLKMQDCIDCHKREQPRTNLNNINECIRCHH